jgi:hypothetical protein
MLTTQHIRGREPITHMPVFLGLIGYQNSKFLPSTTSTGDVKTCASLRISINSNYLVLAIFADS